MKNEIKCPKCGTVFQINENDYESILAQIKNHEFNDALNLAKFAYESGIDAIIVQDFGLAKLLDWIWTL